MTGREWKPDGVGLSARGRLALRREHDPDGWIDSAGAPWSNKKFPNNVRPLVVIDPEDREQVERLREAFRTLDCWTGDSVDDWQTALREFANPKPAKPDEPTAMWSVVVDDAGDQWVRVLGPDFTDGWVRAGDLPSNGKWTDYSDIDAVEVVR